MAYVKLVSRYCKEDSLTLERELIEVNVAGRLFHSVGASTVPWGTPVDIAQVSDKALAYFVDCSLFVRYELNQDDVVPELKLLCCSILMFIVSKKSATKVQSSYVGKFCCCT